MPPELVYSTDEGQEHRFPLDADIVRIGRSADNDLVIHHGSISRHHAELRKEHGVWKIFDLGSKNGTHVNQVGDSTSALKDGDEILLGNFPISYVTGSSSSVELTTPASQFDEESGTIFRSAVDFSALAAGKQRRTTAAPALDEDRLRKLLAIVTQASEVLLRSADLEETLSQVLDLVFEHLPVERGFIMLWDEEQERLVERCVKNRKPTDEKIRCSHTIATKVLREKVSVLTTDAQTDPDLAGGASIMALGIRSAMAAPLWNGEKVEGIIYVDTPLHEKAFDDFDLDLLSALGNNVAMALERARLQDSVLDERLSRQRLERYHSPAVVERITQATAGQVLTAEEREVTVLYADVVGFTRRCESMDPRDVAQMLNRCFSEMTEVVFQHEGTLDKFIGDCLMAVFGAPLPMEDHPVRAVRAALDMRDALSQLNEAQPEQDRLEFRIGMHSGRVVAGDIGSVRRSDYTVLGSTVNLASRMQTEVAEPGQIIASDTVYEATKHLFRFRCVGESQPKGIARVVTAYEVLGPA